MRLILKLFGVVIGLVATAAVAVVIFTFTLMPDLPAIESLKDVPLKVPLRIYSAQGSLMAEFGDERRQPVTIDQVPESLIRAILAAEDDSFYSHPGVDFRGVLRAALANMRSGTHEQGASTITMQVAKNYFLTREKTYTRKLKEALLAFRLERALTKDQILELYVNKIFLGHRAYGFAAAARVYYGKSLDELTIPEMAMLAGLPKAPSRNNPLSNEERAIKRRDYVLHRMHDLGVFDSQQLEEALAAKTTASKHAVDTDLDAPYVAEMVRDRMVERYGDEAYWRGYSVFTTIIDENQVAAQNALRKGLKEYDRRHGYRGAVTRYKLKESTTQEELNELLAEIPSSGELTPAVVVAIKGKTATVYTNTRQVQEIPWSGIAWAQRYKTANSQGAKPKRAADVLKTGDVVYVEKDPENKTRLRLSQLPAIAGALVSIRSDDGAILALTGGFDFYLSKFNRVTQAERQPGSNIKPFIYSASLDHGFTPASLVSGAPIVVHDTSQDLVWRPENYSRKFFGPTRLRKALSLSLNLVSVRILRAIGVEAGLDHLAKFGFDRDKLPRGLTLALGSGTATPMTVVRAYSVFANGGYLVDPYFIQWVEDQNGNVVEQIQPMAVCSPCAARKPTPAVEDGASDDGLVVESESTNEDELANGELASDADPANLSKLSTAMQLPPKRRARRVLDAGNHFLITDMMQQVIRSGTGRRALKLGRSDLAGKTGTTNDFRDAWFSGFSGEVVTTVWAGFDDSTTLGRREAGSRAALPIWIDYMGTALKGTRERVRVPTDNIVTRFVHKETGEVVVDGDPNGYEEYFMASNAPAPIRGRTMPGISTSTRVTTSGTSTEGLF